MVRETFFFFWRGEGAQNEKTQTNSKKPKFWSKPTFWDELRLLWPLVLRWVHSPFLGHRWICRNDRTVENAGEGCSMGITGGWGLCQLKNIQIPNSDLWRKQKRIFVGYKRTLLDVFTKEYLIRCLNICD